MKQISMVVKGTEVRVAFDENSIHVYNAYPIKDALKLRGYRWNPGEKSWYHDRAEIDSELAVLKNNLDPLTPKKESAVENLTNAAVREPEPDHGFPKSTSVSALRNRIQRVISETLTGHVWIRGVVASDIKNYKWASYFDLRDEDEQKDLFFSSEVRSNELSVINFKLKQSGVADCLAKDLPVLVLADVTLSYKKNINIKLTVIDIIPEFTREKIKNQREITIDRLKSEGILEKQRRFRLPKLITRIGLISSEQGTSVSDILSGLGKCRQKYDFYFVDARMEGDAAVSSIIRAIKQFEKATATRPDLLIIARGGGSEQSLALFNDYHLCRSVCETSIPVVTAIGHEKDLSAIELCSFLTPSPSTPSGIGKFLFDAYIQTENDLLNLFGNISRMSNELMRDQWFRIQNHLRSIGIINRRFVHDHVGRIAERLRLVFIRSAAKLKTERRQVFSAADRIKPDRIILSLDQKSNDVRLRTRALMSSGERNLKTAQQHVSQKMELAKARDPQQILKKGFALTLSRSGKVIPSRQAFVEQSARLRFHDGEIQIIKAEENNG